MGENKIKKTTIGGQALIEGILMRGPENSSIVIRKSDGSLVTKDSEIYAPKNRLLTSPFVRGVYNMYCSLKEGMEALTYSAGFYETEEEIKPSRFEMWLEKKVGTEKLEKFSMGFALVLGTIIPIALFILLPTILTGIFDKMDISGVVKNIIEGIIRVIIFLVFLATVSKMKDIKRTFSYHGAEHKSIHCYESGEELTVENVRKHEKYHPRCGTSFLFTVMIVSILVFSVFSWPNPAVRLLVRLLMLPVIISISYEINRFVGKHDNVLSKAVRAPGLWIQRFTVFEPDDSMLEVAIEALKRVIPHKKDADKW